MLSLAFFWLASAAIIVLMSLWARANRRRGWRRERSGADVPSVRELMELSEEIRQGGERAAPTPVPLGAAGSSPAAPPVPPDSDCPPAAAPSK
jgi:hypothetical protein